jgi:Phage gp6-like head-tail connector protein
VTDLVSLQEVKKYLRIGKTSAHDDELNAIIPAVSEDIRSYTGFDWDARTYTELRNGNGQPSITALKAGPPGPPITAVTSVKEDGVALTVATGYSTAADVIVNLERGVFTRRPGSSNLGWPVFPGRWSEGVLNLELVYLTGYAIDAIPGDIKLLAKYACAIYFKHLDAKWQGIQSRASGQGSVSIVEELPKMYRGILEGNRRVFVPEA